MKLPCGCLTKRYKCPCAIEDKWHEIYVSPCSDQTHVQRVGEEVKKDGQPPPSAPP